MERLSFADEQEYASRMQAVCRRAMEGIIQAVNNAPQGNVISGSEMQVRDVIADLGRIAFQTAVQMRIDSTESSFSPSEGQQRPEQAGQRPRQSQRGQR